MLLYTALQPSSFWISVNFQIDVNILFFGYSWDDFSKHAWFL